MRSESADAIRRRRRDRVGTMTPDERLGLLLQLSVQGLQSYMDTFGIDRRTAVSRIKMTRQLGRRQSACAQSNAD